MYSQQLSSTLVSIILVSLILSSPKILAQDVNTWTFQTNIYNWAWGHIGPEVRIGKSISKNKKWHVLGGYSHTLALNLGSGSSEASLATYSTNIDYGHEGSLGIMYQFPNRFSLKYLVSIGDYRYKHNQIICLETDQNYDPEIAFCNCLEVASNDFTQQAQRLNVGIELQYTVYQKSSFSIDISGALFIIGGRQQFYNRLNHNSCPDLNIRPNVPDFSFTQNYLLAQNTLANTLSNANFEWYLTGVIPRLGIWLTYKL